MSRIPRTGDRSGARGTRVGVLALLVWVVWSGSAAAEWQFKPFLGQTFGADTTLYLLDLEGGALRRHTTVGASVQYLGEVFGVEGDVGFVPGFFERGNLTSVAGSRVTTLTGSVVVALPARMARYTLRPYAVAGLGLMRASNEELLAVFEPSTNMLAFNVGGGVTGFLTERFGLSWDLRYFRGNPRQDELSRVPPTLSFWRINMALAVRY